MQQKRSLHAGIELSVAPLDRRRLIVLVHLRQIVALLVQVGGHRSPPDGEMLLHRAAEIRTMRRRLCHEFVEGLVRSLPGGCLHAEEGGERERERHSHVPADGRALDDWTSQKEGQAPADHRVSNKLAGEFLQLPVVEGLHLEHLVVSQIVVVDISQPVPVLSGANLRDVLVTPVG